MLNVANLFVRLFEFFRPSQEYCNYVDLSIERMRKEKGKMG